MTRTRPETTLFLLMSLDGKISTGDYEGLDVDRDFPRIQGVREGLDQYYDLEKKTDVVSFNTGRVMAKIGVNEATDEPKKIPVDFVIVDGGMHLDESGVRYLAKKVDTLILVVTNGRHAGYALRSGLHNLVMLRYDKEIDFPDLFDRLGEKWGMERMTIQSGGTMNAHLLRLGLIDHVSVVVAPVLIGGKDTPTLVDGESLHSVADLHNVRPLVLRSCTQLEHSYLHLQYDVMNKFEVR